MRLAWERRYQQPAAGNPLWERAPFVTHLAALIAHKMLDQDAGPPEERTIEGLVRQVMAEDNERGGYDEIAAELDAIADAGGDPFAAVNAAKGEPEEEDDDQ